MTFQQTSSSVGSARPISHSCSHPGCSRWGAWGYDRGAGVTGWWCLEHRPEADPFEAAADENWVSDGNEG